jgi:hypothetical protein
MLSAALRLSTTPGKQCISSAEKENIRANVQQTSPWGKVQIGGKRGTPGSTPRKSSFLAVSDSKSTPNRFSHIRRCTHENAKCGWPNERAMRFTSFALTTSRLVGQVLGSLGDTGYVVSPVASPEVCLQDEPAVIIASTPRRPEPADVRGA